MSTFSTRHLTIGSLRELIRDLPDSTPVLTPGQDHAYQACEATVTTAGKAPGKYRSEYWMWYGEENASEGEVPVKALVVT